MDSNLERIKEAEDIVEGAVWTALSDKDHEKELGSYLEAKQMLDGMGEMDSECQKEWNRVMSYCLMRIDNAEISLGQESDIERVRESLRLAEASEDPVQIARSSLALGITLLNQGKLPDAEEQWRRVFKLAEGHDEDKDMQQVVGWTLVVRANVLMGKSLYNQARHLGEEAAGILSSIENYAGLAAANRVLTNAYQALGDEKEADRCREMVDYYQERANTERK
ncbi:MAG: hypothetical protein RTU92_03080 [Candidatus Thorarchaeota archaeon]